jgi:HD-GYP domain-containing protein (c-di-GMP phosphodiesterase class II)
MTKRIPIEQLRLGMYVVGIDKSWWQTPFLSHKWTVQSTEEIQKLIEIDVREVVIDPTRGRDVEETSPSSTQPLSTIPPLPQPLLEEPSSSPSQALLDNAPQDLRCEVMEPLSAAPPPPSSEPPSLLDDVRSAIPAAREARAEAHAILESIFEGVKIGKPVDSPALKRAVSGLLESLLCRPEASLILTRMRQFEGELLTHALDVCIVSLLIGQQQELSLQQLEALGIGALLHDLGKTRLPRNLLRQSALQNPYAQKLLNEHPRLGVSLVTYNKEIPEEARRIILEHHEYANGSGFPEGRSAAQLSPLGQIVGIVNIYDSLVSSQNGKPAYLPTQALRQLYQMGREGKLAQEQVAWAIRALGIYPIGAVVELDTGERGIVIATNSAEAQKPVVLVVCDKDGQPFPAPRLVNLTVKVTDEPIQSIVRPLTPAALPQRLADYFKETL